MIDVKKYKHEHYLKNKEKILQKTKAYYQEHKQDKNYKEKRHLWYINNKDKCLKSAKEAYKKDPIKKNKINRASYQKHKEKRLLKTRAYYLVHPEVQKLSGKKYQKTAKGIYTALKARCKKQGWELDFSREWFIEWFNNQPKICSYCNQNIIKSLELSGRPSNLLTIDRKNSSRSYLKDNITLSCYRCNLVKSNFFSFEEMKKISEVIKKIDLDRKEANYLIVSYEHKIN